MTTAQLPLTNQKAMSLGRWSRTTSGPRSTETSFGGGRQKTRRNHHISYLQEEIKCPSEIVEVYGCNSPVCNDETLLKFRDFDAADGDASHHSEVDWWTRAPDYCSASMRAIDTIFYAPTAWCTSIP